MHHLYRLDSPYPRFITICLLIVVGALMTSALCGCSGKGFRRTAPASGLIASGSPKSGSVVALDLFVYEELSRSDSLSSSDSFIGDLFVGDSSSANLFTSHPVDLGGQPVLSSVQLVSTSRNSTEQDASLVQSAGEIDLGSEPQPEPISPKPQLSLNQAIALTLANDPVLRVGLQEIQQAYAEQVTASLKPNPEVEIIQSLLPLGRPFNEDDRQGGPPQFDVALSYPIDWYWFGKRAAAMQATLQNRMATELEFADLVRQRILLTAVSYFDAVEQQALIELAEQDAENLTAVERITQTAVENGAMPRVDYSRIRLDRLNSEQTLRETRRDLVAAKAALLVAMGLDGSGLDFELESELPEPKDEQFPELDQLFNLAQSNRPDIAALRSRINEARANMTVEYREAFPEITPMMGYTRQFQERAIGFPSVSSWGVGLSMSLPIHNRNQGNRIRAASERVQRMEELRAGLVELRGELIEVLADLEAARANAISTAEEQLVLAEEVRDSIRDAYQVGDRPLIDVLDSQRNFRETYRNFINSRADYWRAVQRYQAALANQ